MKFLKIAAILLLIILMFTACSTETGESTETEEIISDVELPQSTVGYETESALFRDSSSYGSFDLTAKGRLWFKGRDYGSDIVIDWKASGDPNEHKDALSKIHVNVNAFYNIKSSKSADYDLHRQIHGNKYAMSCQSRAFSDNQNNVRIKINGSESANIFENRYISYYYIINDLDPSDCLRIRAAGGLLFE